MLKNTQLKNQRVLIRSTTNDMRIVVQPCGDSAAKEHFVDTVEKLVPKNKIYPFLDKEQRRLFDIYCGESVAVWGVTEGKTGQNKTKWGKLKSGDIALLYTKKRIFNKGKITLCIHNEELARSLWSTNKDGKTWEYIYFLDELQKIDLPILSFNEALGYKSNYIIQGFNVLENEKAELLADLLGESEQTFDITAEDTAIESIQLQLDALEKIDLPSSSKSRQESQLFRKFLFGKTRTQICDICSKELPTRLLVAAHIKPRADCTEKEKRDLNVIFRACKLGCDELFERSYLIVDAEGKIAGTENLDKSTTALKEYALPLLGKTCIAFNEFNKDYFGWRENYIKRYIT